MHLHERELGGGKGVCSGSFFKTCARTLLLFFAGLGLASCKCASNWHGWTADVCLQIQAT